MGCLMLIMPESPYIMVAKGRVEKARKDLRWLRGPHYDVEEDIALMKQIEKEQSLIGKITLADLFTRGIYLKVSIHSLY